MIHLSSDMSDSICKNFTDILQKYNIHTSLPVIAVDEQNEVVRIGCFSVENGISFAIDYAYPFGLSLTALSICASDSIKDIKIMSKFIKNLKNIENKIDAMVIPYIKEEF